MRISSLRGALLATSLALLLGAAAFGLALAQETPTPTPTAPSRVAPSRPAYQTFLDALAKRLGISTEQLQQAIAEARNEVGLPGSKPFGPGMFGPGRRGHGFGHGGLNLSVAAQAIGITVDQLRQELPGKSLAQVAQAHGKDPSQVAQALKDAANQRIDRAVSTGRLSVDQASRLKQQASQRIDRLMDWTVPQIPHGFGGPWRGPKPAPTPQG